MSKRDRQSENSDAALLPECSRYFSPLSKILNNFVVLMAINVA